MAEIKKNIKAFTSFPIDGSFGQLKMMTETNERDTNSKSTRHLILMTPKNIAFNGA